MNFPHGHSQSVAGSCFGCVCACAHVVCFPKILLVRCFKNFVLAAKNLVSCKKAKWLSEEALQIAVKRRDKKGKQEINSKWLAVPWLTVERPLVKTQAHAGQGHGTQERDPRALRRCRRRPEATGLGFTAQLRPEPDPRPPVAFGTSCGHCTLPNSRLAPA